MEIAYITNTRIPSERANAMQTAQMCAAFAAAGAQVTLYCPDRRNQFAGTDVWAYYHLPRTFELCRVPCVDLFYLSGGRLWLERPIFWQQTATFAFSLLRRLKQSPPDLFYSRDPFVLALLSAALPQARRRMLFEAHGLPASRGGKTFRRWALQRVAGVVAISHALRQLHIDRLGLSPESVWVAHDGVDLNRFEPTLSKIEARQQLRLPLDERLVMYTGGLYAGRGLEELITAAKGLTATLIIVGGKDEASAARFRRFASEQGVTNVRFEGYRPPPQVPLYLAAADVLAMPYSRRTVAPGGITTDWMSPLKMFEYMAAARPIIASDLPVLREVLHSDENALLVPPDDAVALAVGLERLLADTALSERLAAQARRDVAAFTWEARARAILNFASCRETRNNSTQ